LSFLISRRSVLAAAGAAPAAAFASDGDLLSQATARTDASLDSLLNKQVLEAKSPYLGAFPNEHGLHWPISAAGAVQLGTAAFLHPSSKHHRQPEVLRRIQLAADFLLRSQSPDGNIDLPITNFNSPPDTAFAVRAVANAALVARRAQERSIYSVVEPFLLRATEGLVKGGVHTPNHRWVICAALSQLYELFHDARCLDRIDQWLAEGIDIDPEGQYSERSTAVYNPIVNSSLITMAEKLGRPQLLESVRRNLESMLFLLHPGYEVVTEISTRQDLNQRGDMGVYWFSLQYMAVHDSDGRFATIARHFAPTRASLPELLEYPQLLKPAPLASVPDNYRRHFPHNRLLRFRRGPVSATVLLEGRSNFFSVRRGAAVIQAIRFASAFFGKGQFIPATSQVEGSRIRLTQRLQAGYYQPLDPPRPVDADSWAQLRPLRRQTEVAQLHQSAEIRETARGFSVRIQAMGTKGVPVAIEVNLRPGGHLTSVQPCGEIPDTWLLAHGYATYEAGGDRIRFGPGRMEHSYILVRGAEAKFPGPSVYLTGLTPFDHTLEIDISG
jgi:hypothetical protein